MAASLAAVTNADLNLMLRRSIRYFVVLACVFTLAMPAMAAELQLTRVHLDTCNEQEGGQPDFKRPMGASCYVLRGDVENPGRKAIIDTDVFARILDASGEPVLQNRTRVGSIGDVEPGSQPFALRLTVPAGTPGPFVVKNAKARGFSAPVRTRVADDEDDLLPLERQVAVN